MRSKGSKMRKSLVLIFIVLFLFLIKIGNANADSKGHEREDREFGWNWKRSEDNWFKGRHSWREWDDDDFKFDDHHKRRGKKEFNVVPEPISTGLFLLGGGALIFARRNRKKA